MKKFMFFMYLSVLGWQTSALAISQERAESLARLAGLNFSELQEVNIMVSGASKFAQPVTQAPASVTIVNADEIKLFGFRTLGEVLESVRGMDITDDGIYQFAGTRGFARSGDFSSRLLVLLDGQRINDNVYENGPFALDFMLDVDLIERVEVVRGPAAALYGTNALFGIINVITKRGAGVAAGEVKLFAQDDGHRQGRATYAGRLDKAEWLWSVTAHEYEGQDLYFSEFDTPDSDGIAHKRDAERSLSGFFRIDYGGWRFSGAHVKRRKNFGQGYAWTLFDTPNEYVDTHNHLDVNYNGVIANAWRVQAGLRYGEERFEAEQFMDGADRGLEQVVDINLFNDHGRWWTAECAINHQWGSHNWVVGLEYQYNQTQSSFDYYPSPYQVNRDRSAQNRYQWALFAQDDIRLSEQLRLSATLRYDASKVNESALSPRLALLYQPHKNTVLKLLVNEAFRFPTAYELSFPPSDGSYMDAEHIRAYELSWEQRLSAELQTDLSIYRNELQDILGWLYAESENTWHVDNVSDLTTQGIEWGLQGAWWKDWSGRLSYAYHDTHIDNADIYTNAPQHTLKLNLAYHINSHYSLGWRSYYNSRRATGLAQPAFIAAYSVSYLSLLAHPWGEDTLELAVHLYNVFDQDYRLPVDIASYPQASMQQAGRTLGVSLRYQF